MVTHNGKGGEKTECRFRIQGPGAGCQGVKETVDTEIWRKLN